MKKHIDALRKKRNEHLDAMTALSDLAGGESRLFTPDEQKAFDKAEAEIKDIDAQIARFEALERAQGQAAKPAPNPLDPVQPPARTFKPFPGQAFTRYIGCLAASKGNLLQAVELAKRFSNETPEVLQVLQHAATIGNTNDPTQWVQRAAQLAGTTTHATWAAPLVNYQIMSSEFIELLRPMTIMGKLTSYRRVPFNIKIPRQTAGVAAQWVGEGLSKPVGQLAFDSVTFPFAKIAIICVITQELARFSDPSAEMLVRDDLIQAIVQFMDQQFIDGSVAASAGVRPGSINNTSPNIPSTGGTVATVTTDLTAAIMGMVNANIAMQAPVWIMSWTAAMFLATLRTAQDVFAFPSMSAGGAPGTVASAPTLMGIPVIISGNVPMAGALSSITLLEQTELMIADDGQVTVDTSTEASLQLDSAPATPPTPLVSLWQQNLLGIRAERFCYWLMRRTAAVQEITGFHA